MRSANVTAWMMSSRAARRLPRPLCDHLAPAAGEQLDGLAAEHAPGRVRALMEHARGRPEPRLDAGVGRAEPEVEVLPVEEDLRVEWPKPA